MHTMMRFTEGSRVEVLRKKKETYGSWFPARILSKAGSSYTVRYELYLNSKGEAVVEIVNEEDVRPCPSSARGGESWVLGDIAEVFDLRAWRLAKVAKILSGSYVVVRLLDSIQLKKFHVLNLRVRQAWRDGRWILLGKASEEEEVYNSSKRADRVKDEAACNQDYTCLHPTKTVKKNFNTHNCSFPIDGAVKGNNSKRRWISEVGEDHLPTKRSLPKEVDAFPFSHDFIGKNYMQSPSTALPFTEEDIECSVASCSGNNLPEYNNRKKTRENSGSCFDDMTSSAPKAEEDYPNVSEDDLAANIHELELHAYKSTIEALYASGPLSWEQESLLTNLRMSLHISNEEHLLQVKNLLSA